ncbi:hypothetical protein RND71_042797 [Anisodus tanguticus]|uniref:KIB1-4 beta-propeller domain-containing protein n=1 Tax=Anisodus tanguticus TaxID=243964 RepID=A0AAE1QRL4_9SOLA|nr:hypothetical protein RND71_042797 [Anisodus tanguticus]
MNLLHPLSHTQIQLPSREDLLASQGRGEGLICMDNAILSASPSFTSDCVLLVSYYEGDDSFLEDNCLSFWRPDDLNWTNIVRTWSGKVTGINYYKDQFYFVTLWSGKVWVFDVAEPAVPQPIVEPHFHLLIELEYDAYVHLVQFYLVELYGDYYLLPDCSIVRIQLVQMVGTRPLNLKSLN